MRIKRKSLVVFLLLLLLLIIHTPFLYPQASVEELRTKLIERLSHSSQTYPVPVPGIYLDQNLPTNAKYEPDSIFLGKVQKVFQSFDDSLSLIYHEYIHHLLYKAQKYEVALDSTGKIVQWLTEESYLYTPFPEEVNLYLRHFEEDVLPDYPNYKQMDPQEKERILTEMEEVFSQPQKSLFKYAPSNLAKEEIFAYKQQLKGEKLGLFVLSTEARQNLHMRIKQFKTTYRQRRVYEKKNNLLRSGAKRRN